MPLSILGKYLTALGNPNKPIINERLYTPKSIKAPPDISGLKALVTSPFLNRSYLEEYL